MRTAFALATVPWLLLGCDQQLVDRAQKGEAPSTITAPGYAEGEAWPLDGGLRLMAIGKLGGGSNRVDYALQTSDGKTVAQLPEFYGNDMWSYWDTRAVAYEDIDGDARKDIVILASFMTGIGPGGADPFDVAGFYLNTDQGFQSAEDLDDLANSEQYAQRRGTVEDLVALGRELHSSRVRVEGQP
ncbi:MAG: hypothetical protein ACRD1T_15130 [Acidimicrobiia bacterium]